MGRGAVVLFVFSSSEQSIGQVVRNTPEGRSLALDSGEVNCANVLARAGPSGGGLMTRKHFVQGMAALLVAGLMVVLSMPAVGAAAATGSITGTVTTTSGAPLAGVMVSAYGTGAGGSAKTSSSGHYEITGLAPGSDYVVSFTPADSGRVLGGYFGGGSDWQSATRISVVAGVATTGINQSLVTGATISGRVIDATGRGLPGVFVNATNYTYYYQYQPYLGVEGFVTDANGYYSVYGLPTGSYRVQFVAPAQSTLMSVYYGGGRDYRSSAIVKATAGSDTPLNVVTLYPGATISGVVSGPDGPVAGAQVVVGPTMSSKLRRSALTGADGSYSVGGVLTDTDLVVGFYAPPTGANSTLRTEFWNDASSEGAAAKLRVTSGQQLGGISPVLARQATISGIVSGPTGPAPGVAVQAQKVCGPGDDPFSCINSIRPVVTAEDGSYSLQVSSGTWQLWFDPARGQSADLLGQIWNSRPLDMSSAFQQPDASKADLITVADGQRITNVNPVLTQGGTITGRVTSGGLPAVGVSVLAVNDVLPAGWSNSSEFAYAPQATTTPDGSYRIAGLRPGVYRLGFLDPTEVQSWNPAAATIASSWYSDKPSRSTAEAVTVAAGSVLTADAVLAVPGSISGTINDLCGAPRVVASEIVSPFRSREVQYYTSPSSATQFTIGGLWPTTYTVRVEGSCGKVDWYPVTATTSATATPITLPSGGAITGISLRSSPIGASATVPQAPSLPQVSSVGDGAVVVSTSYFANQDSDGGSPITGYVVTSVPEGRTCEMEFYGWSGWQCPVRGLTNGRAYQFVIQAKNQVGTSPMSEPTSSVVVGLRGTPTTPSKPVAVVAAASSTKATVSWKAPTSNGGSPVTGYTATAAPGGRSCSTTGSLSCVVTGLTNGTAYSFAVVATTNVGTGPSATSASVIPKPVPDAPLGAVAVAGATSATVRWSAPSSNGGSAITSYKVTSSPGASTCTTATLTCTVTGLINGTTYSFKVTATNSAGTGPAAVSTPATPQPAFGAPTAITAVAGNRMVSLAWSAPAATGGSAITSYLVTATAVGRACWSSEQSGCLLGATSGPASPEIRTCSTTDLHCDLTGLWNGVTYRLSVQALNASRTGPSSNVATATPRPDPPTAPTGVSAVASTGSATVTWTASSFDGDSRIISYTATSSPEGKTCSWSSGPLTCTVTGLTHGTSYTFTVKATNAIGDSVASVASSPVMPKGPPGVPLSVTAGAANGAAAVSWVAPVSNGGAAISSYVVTSSPEGKTCSWSSGPLTCTVSGLTNGTSYTFSVVAINSFGSGPISGASSGVTPRTVPGAPTSVTGAAANGSVAVSWSVPSSNGGAVITKYTVTSSPGGKTCAWSSGPLTCTVTGLTNGTAVTFTVVATNAAGDGAASSPSQGVTPRTIPGAPRSVTGVAANGSVTVSWLAPLSNGGAVITKYTVTASPSGRTCTWSAGALSCTVTGLTNGTNYTFTVKATNIAGIGSASAASAFIKPHL